MAYNLTLTDGSLLKVLNDNTVDNTTTSINLVGRNYSGYGALVNQNFIKILENFSSGSSPIEPLAGQLWWDKLNNRLNVYVISSGYTGWRPVSATQIGPYTPLAPEIGTLWWDTSTTSLKAYSGATVGWVTVGPQSLISQAILANTVIDYYGSTHIVGNLIVNNKLAAIISSDSTPFRLPDANNIGGLSNISPGINFTLTTQTGMISSPAFRLGVFNSNVDFSSLGVGNSIRFSVSPTIGSNITALLIDSTTGLTTVAANATSNFGVATKVYVDSLVQTANSQMKTYVDAANLAVNANLGVTVTTANSAMKAYVDDKVAASGSGSVTSITLSGGTTGLTPESASITTSGTFTLGGNLRAKHGGTGRITYSRGDMLYAPEDNPNALSKLAIGSLDSLLISNGTLPTWSSAASFKAGSATTVFSSGVANYSVLYQFDNLTQFLSPGSANQVLSINGSGQLAWTTVAAGGATVTVENDNATNSSLYPLFFNSATSAGASTVKTSNALRYNPSTGVLSATGFSGSGTSLTNLSAAALEGTIPSAVLANSSLFVGTSQLALNRASATQTLAGVSIDGTAAKATNIVGGAANRIPYQTAVDSTSFIPAGGENSVLVAGVSGLPAFGTAPIAGGGTGRTTVGSAGSVVYTNGTGYLFTAVGASGQVLTSSGAGAPTWTSLPSSTNGTVTSVSASVPSFLSVTVNNNTTTPAIAISYNATTRLPVANGGTGSDNLDTAGILTKTDNQTGISGSKTFTGAVTISADTTLSAVKATVYKETSTALSGTGTVAINLNLGNYFTHAVSATTTYSLSNVPSSGTVASFILVITVTNTASINWWANLRWHAGQAPTLNINGTHTLGFFTTNGGSAWYGFLLGKSMA